MADTGARVVLCTVPDAETGSRLARAVVEERLAACVNMLPAVHSFYAWEGEVQSDPELLLIVKTREPRLQTLCQRLVELHPYDVPEVIALEVSAGSQPYLDWIAEGTR